MMRKYIVGGLIGFLLAVPFTAFGEQISSLVGKQIKSEHAIIADGKALSKKAISIDGTTYAPLRAVADAVGYDIAFTNSTVILSNPAQEGDLVDTTTPTATPASPFTLKDVNFNIDRLNSTIQFTKETIVRYEESGNTEEVESLNKFLSEKEAELAVWEQRKTDLEAK